MRVPNLPLAGVILALIMVLSRPVLGAYFDGMFAFDTGDYARALEEWRAEAARGDAKSFYGLGQLYEEGRGVKADPVLAYAYYDLAYLRGYDPAVDARERVGQALHGGELAAAKAVVAEVKNTGKLPPVTREGSFGEVQTPPAISSPPAAAQSTQGQQAAVGQAPAVIPVGKAAIELIYVCELRMKWSDEGSGGNSDIALYEPVIPSGYSMVGGYAQGNYEEPHGCVAAIKPRVGGLLLAPGGWKRVWTDEGSGARRDGSIWQAVPASEEFVCLGAIAQAGYQQPGVSNYACVHRCMVQELAPSRPMWTDEGTGARSPVAIYQIPLTNTLAVFPHRNRPPMLPDLDPMAACLYGQ